MERLLTLFTWTSVVWIVIGIGLELLVAARALKLAPEKIQRARRGFTLGCTLILGSAFFLFGTDKVIGWDASAAHAETLDFYQTWYGLSPGFMVLTGWIQTLSAVLLCWHRRHWVAIIGAGLILCTCVAAIYFHLAYDPAGPFLGMPSIMGALLAAIILVENRQLVLPVLVRIRSSRQ